MSRAFDFGAVGDGATDDTAALQHALDAGDGVLALERGTYRITRPLLVDLTKHGWAAVRGDGGTSRIVMAGPGPALRLIGDHRGTANPASVGPAVWKNERFPTVSGVEIVGGHAAAVGIELRKTMQASVSQVLVRNCRHGIHLVERNRNFILSDSHLYDNAEYGLFFDRCNLHQTIVHGCHVSYNKKAGIKSTDGDVHNLQITGCDIEYNNHPGADANAGKPTGAEIFFEATQGVISEVTIVSNTIQATVEPGGANIRVFGSEKDAPRGARLITIAGNVIGSQMRGVEIRRAQRLAITGNTIYDSRDLSLFLVGCSGAAVGSNTLVWRGGDEDPRSDGIRLEDCENVALTGLVTQRLCAGSPEKGAGVTLVRCTDCAVSDCQILDPLVRGIELEDCRRCRVANNTIVDRRRKPSMRQAIRVVGTSRENLIQANLTAGARERLIDSPAEASLVQGNVELPLPGGC